MACRKEMLKYKELEASKKDIEEGTICANSKVLCKILKPGCKVLEKFSKSQHNCGIILGPQKRTWNTGCHVTQTKRSPNDSFVRGNKGQSEYKFSRGDNRGNFGRSNTANNGNFSRRSGPSKESAHIRGRASDSFNDSETEPEWFTEGPETVNDTVELGMSIDDDGEFKPTEKPSISDKGDTVATASINPSVIDSAILSIDKELLPYTEKEASKPSEVTDSDLLKLFNIPKKKTNEGSLVLKLLNDSNANPPLPKNNPPGPSQDNANFVLKFSVTDDDDQPVATNSRLQTPISSSQPSPSDLSSMFRDLVLRGNASSLPLDVPNVSSKSSLLSSVPTVEQIEAAALAKGRSGNFQNFPISGYGHPEQSTRGRSILETLRLTENTRGLPRHQGFDSYNPQQASMSNWSETSFNRNQGNNMTTVNSSGDSYHLGDQFMRLAGQGGYGQRSQVAGRNLPNDPAIATAIPQRRGIPLNPTRSEFEQAVLAAQNRHLQQQQQQQSHQQNPFFHLHQSYRSGIPTSSLRPSASVEAAMSQMRGQLLAMRQQNPPTPPNSTFSSTTTLRGSGNINSTQLEQYLQSTTTTHRGGGIGLSTIDNFYISQPQQHRHLSQQSPQYVPLRHNGSAPILQPPSTSGGFDMFLCNYDNSFVDPHLSHQRKRLI
ncbi:unnamed protein product [Rodentolepis nana]|uniref:PAP-associated domain-containing protein n=1 Tax=Rodentolepis nana TaxID=102285 RepID=A0A0R3TV53_RODNA|nr:unnamed protein product [Rodentolepis nana]